jgi:hypothetical protein
MARSPNINESQKDFIRNCKKYPEFFFEKVLRKRVYDKQIEIAHAMYDHRRVYVPACHASGKTYLVGGLVLQFLYTHPNSIVITTAPTGRQVKKVLWGQIRAHYNGAAFDLGGNLLTTELVLDDQWYAMGFATDDPDRFQGIHSPTGSVLVAVDEAAGVPPEIHEAMEGIMTGTNTYMIQIANPTTTASPFYTACTSGVGKVMPLSYLDTPNIRAGRTIIDGLIDQHWVDEKAKLWGVDSPLFKSRVLGEFPDEGDDTLVPVSWIMDAIKNVSDHQPRGPKRMGVDIARYGSDVCCVVVRQGNVVLDIVTWSGRDLMESTGRVVRLIHEHQVDPRNVYVDDGGLGGGVVDRLLEQNFNINPKGFGTRSPDPSRFANWRSWAYWKLRREFEDREIAIPDNPRLTSDLTTLRYEFRSSGEIQIMSKEKMRKLGFESTDYSDALLLASQYEMNEIPGQEITSNHIQQAIYREISAKNILERHFKQNRKWRGIHC